MKIPIDSVTIPKERFREEIDETALKELAESLANIGQLHPIIVSRDGRLIAGQRRLLAARSLGWTEIDGREWESMDPLEQKVVEYEENSKRRQLTWQEEARAVADIHRLCVEKDRLKVKAPGDLGHTLGETAQLLGISLTKVSEDLQLAGGLDNPRIAARPSKKGALQTSKRERELELVRELARRRTQEIVPSAGHTCTQFAQGVIYHADCLDVLRTIPDDSIDLIVTDPPWGISLPTASQWLRKWVPTYDDSTQTVRNHFALVARELYRVLKGADHIYLFLAIQDSPWWVDTLGEVGFVLRNRPLIWHKTGAPSITDTYTAFQPSYEAAIWGYKPGEGGYRRFFSKSVVESYAVPRSDGRWHENEKPIELLDPWIEASSDLNEVVLDPFCGGASSCASSFGLGRYYIGVEKDEVNYTKCVERMLALEAQDDKKEVDLESLLDQ